MQLIRCLLSNFYLNMFRASLCPSSGEQDRVLLHMVFCTGCAGCGCVELCRALCEGYCSNSKLCALCEGYCSNSKLCALCEGYCSNSKLCALCEGYCSTQCTELTVRTVTFTQCTQLTTQLHTTTASTTSAEHHMQ